MPATVHQIGPLRTCSKCKESKLIEEFSPTSRVKSGLQRECKSCVVKRASVWAKANPDKVSSSKRRRRYHVDFNAMWVSQSANCAICHAPMLPKGKQSKSVVVDHDRKCCPDRGSCGKCVRGLVHSGCNVLLRYLENPEFMRLVEFAREYS